MVSIPHENIELFSMQGWELMFTVRTMAGAQQLYHGRVAARLENEDDYEADQLIGSDSNSRPDMIKIKEINGPITIETDQSEG